ncbi:hypothetical protein PGT21_009007 [Puccinia graminis f. sp. tritici]|uniref:Uncharacterized protein n=1 Tax=Puccinia graminis f. sp. tritici TaxID=56615 RepID=A0A5B0Q2B0_PUCGR|nr:hypothetical protein PGT21_009007 [Puccinia graminis f. sp. tritici]
MLTQRNTLFITLAITFTSLLLNVQALALPVSQTEGVHYSYLKRNVNATISAPVNPKAPLVQRDIPPPVLKAIDTVGKFIKRDSLVAERDIPQTQSVHYSYLKRNVNTTLSTPVNPKQGQPQPGVPLVQRDIPPQGMKVIETVGKYIKRDSLAEHDIPHPHRRNVNTTISAPLNPKQGQQTQPGVPLVQRDIPPQVMKVIETVGKYIKRDSLERNVNPTISTPVNPKQGQLQPSVPLVQRDIPPQVMKVIETVGKYIKRDSLAKRDIPPQVMKVIETVGKLV